MIRNFIILEYIVNLILLLLFHMHMFQLNSYFFKKHMHWMKTNIKKILIQIFQILISVILLAFNNIVLNIFCILVLAFSIYYNFPKNKAKISLNYTNRIKRMFITEIFLITCIFFIKGIQNGVYIKLCILNLLSPIICIIANFINSPIELLIHKKYIRQAKKILQSMPNLIVIGVTGSFGKTSVKNFLYKTLSTKYEVLMTPKNYNTTMGVVKTIRENLKPFHQIFICEMGATNVGDIKEICDIVNPKIGIITAIGPQHLENFKTMDNLIKTKFELADSVLNNNGTIFLNYDNEYLNKQEVYSNFISYGINNKNLNYNAYDLSSSSKGLSFKMIDSKNNEVIFKSKVIGKHNIVNMAGAIAVSNHLGINLNSLVPSIRKIESVKHRLELISNDNFTIIDDSYNSNPVSAKSALDTLSEFEGTKIIITPGLIELGENEEKYNFEFGQAITNVCNYIFLVGHQHSKPVFDGILSKKFSKKNVFVVNSPQEAMKNILNLNIKGNITVLLENDLPDNYNI